jgi:hypothetical protein
MSVRKLLFTAAMSLGAALSALASPAQASTSSVVLLGPVHLDEVNLKVTCPKGEINSLDVIVYQDENANRSVPYPQYFTCRGKTQTVHVTLGPGAPLAAGPLVAGTPGDVFISTSFSDGLILHNVKVVK